VVKKNRKAAIEPNSRMSPSDTAYCQPDGVVNIVTKSGTNQYHGDVFEFLRNGNVNARNFFAPTHDLLKRNQFGGTLGGKIIRDKLFFFGGYQGTRIRNVSPSTTAWVPTAAELSGGFSIAESPTCIAGRTTPRPISTPAIRDASGSVISPAARIGNTSNVFASGIQFDPAALALVKYLPKTNDPCGKLTYSTPSIQNEDQGIGRLDWVQSSKHAVFLRYFYTTYLQPAFERMVCFRTARTAFRFAFVDVGKNVRPGSTMAAWKPDAPGEKFASSPCIGPFIFVRHMPRLRVAPSRALRFC
jgi:hypothetical protein